MFALHKRDSNEKAIVAALTAIGAAVYKIQGLPGDSWGVPDLIVAYRGRTILGECKSPTTTAHSARSAKGKRAKGNDGPPENAKGQLTPTQIEWWKSWTGGEAYIFETAEEAVRLVRGEDLPDGIYIAGLADHRRPIVRIVIKPDIVTPGQADALAGALHEQAGVARGMAAEASMQTANRKDET